MATRTFLEVRLKCPICPRRFSDCCPVEEMPLCEEWLRTSLRWHLEDTVLQVGMPDPSAVIRNLTAKAKLIIVETIGVPPDAGIGRGSWLVPHRLAGNEVPYPPSMTPPPGARI